MRFQGLQRIESWSRRPVGAGECPTDLLVKDKAPGGAMDLGPREGKVSSANGKSITFVYPRRLTNSLI